MGFGKDERIRLTPMSEYEPKCAENQPFKAGSDLDLLVKKVI